MAYQNGRVRYAYTNRISLSLTAQERDTEAPDWYVLRGEAGSGKSAVLTEVISGVVAAGIPTIVLHVPSRELFPAFWLWEQLLREISQAVPDATPPASKPLSQIVEAARTREQRHALVFEAIASTVDAACRRGRLVVAIDGVERLDCSSAELLRYLCKHWTTTSISLLLALRDTDPAREACTDRLVQELCTARRARSILLEPLADEDVQALLSEYGLSLPADDRSKLRQKTGGNLLFLDRVTRLLHKAGHEGALTSSVWTEEIPSHLQSAVELRVSGLSIETQRLLRYAAVLGEQFSYDELKAVWSRLCGISNSDLEPVEATVLSPAETSQAVATGSQPNLDSCLLEAVQGACLEYTSVGRRIHRFRHAVLRDVLLMQGAPEDRSRAHVLVARALEDLRLDLVPEAFGRLGWLWISAGTKDCVTRGISYILDGARHAASRSAWEELRATTDYLLETLRRQLDRKTEAECRWIRGAAVFRLGRRWDALADLRLAFQYFLAAGDLSRLEEILGVLSYIEIGDHETMDMAASLAAALPQGTAAKLRAQWFQLLTGLQALGLYDGAVQECDGLLARAVELGEKDLETLIRATRAHVNIRLRNAIAAARDLEGLEAQLTGRSSETRRFGRLSLAQYQLRLGAFEDACTCYRYSLEAARETGDDTLLGAGLFFVARCAKLRGDWSGAVDAARRSLAMNWDNTAAAAVAAISEYQRGEHEAGDAWLHAIVETTQRVEINRGTAHVHRLCVAAFRSMVVGSPAPDGEMLQRAYRLVGSEMHHYVRVRAAFALSEMLFLRRSHGLHVPKKAVRLARNALRLATRYWTLHDVYVQFAHALLFWIDEAVPAASSALRRATRFAEHLDDEPTLAWILAFRADVLRSGTGVSSASLRKRARELASQFGMGGLHAFLDRRSVLSPRERELLVFVESGKTDKEIAVEMSVQPSTVRNHLRRIYAKTNTRGRTQALAVVRQAGYL